MEYAKWKTQTGMTITDLRAALDKELPANAYKSIPGQSYLTDINPGYMKKCLNDVFGICGMGWSYEYQPENLLIQNGSNENWTAVLLRAGTFWFKMLDDAGEAHRITITASGGSENKQMQHALKGAITNMIGNAVSQIGFQESVYMGIRSHLTTNPNPSSQRRRSASTGDNKPAKTTPTAQTPYVVPKGAGIATKHQGVALANMSDAAVQFYAADAKFNPTNDVGKQLQRKCLQEVKARAKATT
jgi:hypothetical protein